MHVSESAHVHTSKENNCVCASASASCVCNTCMISHVEVHRCEIIHDRVDRSWPIRLERPRQRDKLQHVEGDGPL